MSTHPVRDTDDFRAGMAYAAHLIQHAIGSAHGGEPFATVACIEPKRCCQQAVIVFAEGVADGLTETTGQISDHEHRDGRS